MSSNKVFVDFEMTTDGNISDCWGWVKNNRIYEVALIETDENFKPTGNKYHTLINPEKNLINSDDFSHKVSDADLADKPKFADIANDIRYFIADKKIVLSCWTIEKDGEPFKASFDNMDEPAGSFTADIEFLNKEMRLAGMDEFPKEQFVNLRRNFEAMYGHKGASISKMLPRYGLDKEQFGEAHRADADTMMLIAIAQKAKVDFERKLKFRKIVSPIKKLFGIK